MNQALSQEDLRHLWLGVEILQHSLEERFGPVLRGDAEFDETKHSRGADGKFGTGTGTAASKSTSEYHEGLKGKKGSTAGLIKHLLMAGHHEDDVHAEAAHHYGLGDDKKHYVKWYHTDLKKKGVDVPALKTGKAPGEVEKTPEASPVPMAHPPKAETEAPIPTSTKDLKKVGQQLGSNPGGQYTDANGQKYYVKHSKSAEHAANEVLAGHLYHAAGAPIVQAHAIDHEGKPGTISRWQDHEGAFDPNDQAHVDEARRHFATHAWLGNWDAVGLGNDNQVKIGGKLHTVDAGGAMKFRAQGGRKSSAQWGPTVHELDTMRDPSLSPQAAKVFKGITPKQMKESAERLKNVPDEKIRELAMTHGHGTPEERQTQADLLIARKNHVLGHVG